MKKRERKTGQVAFRIYPSLQKKLKRIAKREDVSQAQLVEQAIREMEE